MTKEECEVETSKAIMEMRNHIEELEKEISILLSCKNCPENKGGSLCQKEYEDKCLSQKIQYIKELKEEIAELENDLEQAKKVQVVEHFEAYGQCRDSRRIASLEKENVELKERVKTLTIHDTNAVLNGLEMKVLKDSHRDRANKTQEQLTKAKEIIQDLLDNTDEYARQKAIDFLKEE